MGDSKYITDMKELSPESAGEPNLETNTKDVAKVSQYRKKVNNTVGKNDNKPEKLSDSKDSGTKIDDSKIDDFVIENDKPYTTKDIIMAVINFLCVVAIIFLIIKFPERSNELKNERNKAILNDSGLSYELSEVKSAKTKADEIAQLFVDDSGIADFLNELEKIKADSGLITRISFGNQTAVEDRATGLSGVPVIIDFSGSQIAILNDLEKVQNLPFIIRPISVDITTTEDDTNNVKLKYGALIYVDDSLN